MKFMFGLQHPLTCKPWITLLNPCNKVRGNYNCKEVFLCLPSCIFVIASSLLRRLFMHLSLSLCRCELFYIYMCSYVDVNLHVWLYNSKSSWRHPVSAHIWWSAKTEKTIETQTIYPRFILPSSSSANVLK